MAELPEHIAGFPTTGRILRGPASDLVELDSDNGLKHTAIVFHPEYRDHNGINDALDVVRGFLESPMVTGLIELVAHDREQGAFVYPTGQCWSVAEVIRVLADSGRAGGVRAGLELMYAAGHILMEAADVGEGEGVYSHGGVTPWRIMLKKDGQVLVIGHALPQVEILLFHEDPNRVPSEDSFRYCPPERIEAQAEDLSSDLFALGLVAFELITGKPVYDGLVDDIRRQAARGETSRRLFRFREHLSEPVRDLLGRVLRPDPADRFESGEAFMQAVQQLLGSPVATGDSLHDLMTRVSTATRRHGKQLDAAKTMMATPEELRAMIDDEDDDEPAGPRGRRAAWSPPPADRGGRKVRAVRRTAAPEEPAEEPASPPVESARPEPPRTRPARGGGGPRTERASRWSRGRRNGGRRAGPPPAAAEEDLPEPSDLLQRIRSSGEHRAKGAAETGAADRVGLLLRSLSQSADRAPASGGEGARTERPVRRTRRVVRRAARGGAAPAVPPPPGGAAPRIPKAPGSPAEAPPEAEPSPPDARPVVSRAPEAAPSDARPVVSRAPEAAPPDARPPEPKPPETPPSPEPRPATPPPEAASPETPPPGEAGASKPAVAVAPTAEEAPTRPHPARAPDLGRTPDPIPSGAGRAGSATFQILRGPGGRASRMKLPLGATAAEAVAWLLGNLVPVRLDPAGRLTGWYRLARPGEPPLPAERPMSEVDPAGQLELRFVPNEVIRAEIRVAASDPPARFLAPVGVAVPAASLADHLAAWLGLPPGRYRLLVDGRPLQPHGILADLPGAAEGGVVLELAAAPRERGRRKGSGA